MSIGDDILLQHIQVVSDEEAETCDAVVCAPLGPSPFDDNVNTDCHDCGCAIMHRPYVPKTPKKLCIDCALQRMGGGRA